MTSTNNTISGVTYVPLQLLSDHSNYNSTHQYFNSRSAYRNVPTPPQRYSYVNYTGRTYIDDNSVPLNRPTIYTPQCKHFDRTIVRSNRDSSPCSTSNKFYIGPGLQQQSLGNLAGYDKTDIDYKRWKC